MDATTGLCIFKYSVQAGNFSIKSAHSLPSTSRHACLGRLGKQGPKPALPFGNHCSWVRSTCSGAAICSHIALSMYGVQRRQRFKDCTPYLASLGIPPEQLNRSGDPIGSYLFLELRRPPQVQVILAAIQVRRDSIIRRRSLGHRPKPSNRSFLPYPFKAAIRQGW
jgi:hypothetical protein